MRLTVVDTPGFGDFVNNDERLVVSLCGSWLKLTVYTAGSR